MTDDIHTIQSTTHSESHCDLHQIQYQMKGMIDRINAMESQLNQRLCALEERGNHQIQNQRNHQIENQQNHLNQNQRNNKEIQLHHVHRLGQNVNSEMDGWMDPITISQSNFVHESSSSISVLDHEDLEQHDTVTNQPVDPDISDITNISPKSTGTMSIFRLFQMIKCTSSMSVS